MPNHQDSSSSSATSRKEKLPTKETSRKETETPNPETRVDLQTDSELKLIEHAFHYFTQEPSHLSSPDSEMTRHLYDCLEIDFLSGTEEQTSSL